MSAELNPAFREPPIDTHELCARVRFALDEPLYAFEDHHAIRAQEIARIQHKRAIESLQVTERLTPKLFEIVRTASERLLLKRTPKVFVEPKFTLNASVILGPDQPTVFLHSALVDLLQPDELLYVIGHEFGHALLRHGRGMAETDEQETVALNMSRAAEVSADRIGLVAAGNIDSALRAQLRMKCGLSDKHLNYNRKQVIEDASSHLETIIKDAHSDNSTHPDDAFRVWALAKFAQTDSCAGLIGVDGSESFDVVEAEISERFMALAEGAGFCATVNAVHESLSWLGILIVAEDSDITPTEQEILTGLVGRIWAEDAASYARRNGLEAVMRRAQECLRPLSFGSKSSISRIVTTLRDFGESTRSRRRADEMIQFVREHTAIIQE